MHFLQGQKIEAESDFDMTNPFSCKSDRLIRVCLFAEELILLSQ